MNQQILCKVGASVVSIMVIVALLLNYSYGRNTEVPKGNMEGSPQSQWAGDRQGPDVADRSLSYLPLATGNKWTYQRTIPEGRSPHYMAIYWVKQGKSTIIHAIHHDSKPGTSVETYELLGPAKVDEKAFTACFSVKLGSNKQRDGRYVDATNVYWGISYVVTPGKPAEGPYYNELLILRPRPPVTGSDEPPSWDYTFLWHTGYKTIGPAHYNLFKVFGVKEFPQVVEVPAGKFQKCLGVCRRTYFVVLFRVSKTITERAIVDSEAFCAFDFLAQMCSPGYSDRLLVVASILLPTDQIAEKMEFNSAFSPPPLSSSPAQAKALMDSWHTLSFYAPRVGLVKEQQYGPDGRENYRLELLRYTVRPATK